MPRATLPGRAGRASSLPLTVLRRLDCVLAGTKENVLAKQGELRGKKLENLDPQLRRIAGFAF
ncbi:MAG: restriction endonuclease subunit M [Rhodocyclales bacterium CG17_big_fil_post_rev_8_21_14_2_50_68_7]|nr:MAG: restriction endonuclease subunit M [Rhodocyclales bacterium CG17_big_fil_post_rev_8_21_14_2_50_68_7]PJA57467.1 MAG: restriction endonuclease subunit M [Rhodocyclales bacterium CG_4_9_14_3_um_filter_68_10]